MDYITVKFIDKEYSIPQDVLTYIDLLSFTDSVQKQLVGAFVRKLKNEIAKENIGLLGDKDLATEIEQQVGRFIAKLCDNGIYTRTISDYLKNNKGYQLYSDVNKAALENAKSLLIREMEEWKVGYDNAVSNAESHVTGMGFSIWSGSFVNHAIYAAMEASKLKEQSKEAEVQYQKDMSDLRSRLDSQYGGEQSNYINNTYIPNMEAVFTVFAYELLDKYVADLIANGKFDSKALDYVDIGRSNDLLKNLTLSNNKQAILENAFAACPYNIAVYIQAMKYDLLDYDAFQTAKEFKQDHLILSFLKESWGEVSFPTKFNINYQRINLWALFTRKTSEQLLRELTEQYVAGIVKAYSQVAEMLTNKQLCRKVMGDCSEVAISAGDAICKTKAHSYVDTIVSSTIWNQLTEKCGHPDLLDRIKEYNSAELSEKVVRGLTENALKCKYNGGTLPIGYTVDENQFFQIDPVAAPAVLEAFKKYAKGATMQEITDDLNIKGIRTSKGTKISLNTVTRMLHNRRYIGEYQYRDVVVPNGIPAIVPAKLFEQVQERSAANKKAPAKHKAEDEYLLTTKLFCGYCKCLITGESGTSHTMEVHRYYKCRGTRKGGTCKKKTIKKKWIEEVVILLIQKFIFDDEFLNRLADMLIAKLNAESSTLPILRKQLDEIEKGIDNLVNAIQAGILTASTKQRLEQLEAEKSEISVQILKEEIAKPTVTKDDILAYLVKYRKLNMKQLDHRRRLIDSFVNAIYLFDDYLVITFNYKEGTKTITFAEIEEAFGSDLSSLTAPNKAPNRFAVGCLISY